MQNFRKRAALYEKAIWLYRSFNYSRTLKTEKTRFVNVLTEIRMGTDRRQGEKGYIMCDLSFNGLPKPVIGQSPAERGRH